MTSRQNSIMSLCLRLHMRQSVCTNKHLYHAQHDRVYLLAEHKLEWFRLLRFLFCNLETSGTECQNINTFMT